MDIKRAIGIGTIAIGAVAITGFLWIWSAPCAFGGCAPLDELAEYHVEGSELLDVEGEPFARLATVNRKIVSLDSLPPYLPAALIAIEDQRFYEHGGIDFRRTLGALFANVRSRAITEGGSTITQQLARNLFPEWLPYRERNLRRKVLEARVARQIERTFNKDKILELYLNHVYMGSGAYGIEAAANTYFGKSAQQLSLSEAATLAGLPQAPSQINPRANLERAMARRDLVLDKMVEVSYIDDVEAAEAKAEVLTIVEESQVSEGPESSYFVEQVRRELEETVGNRFYTAGLKIYTTLDQNVQTAAETELERQLEAIESGRFGTYRHTTYAGSGGTGESAYLQGAVVVLDALSGEVRALVGGRDFTDSNFNRATQALRQPGSAFKPFVYTAALERYRSPAHIVEDSPIRLTLASGQVWEPRNYTDDYAGPITMREALTRSKNAATVRLAQDVGIGTVTRTAHTLGIESDIPDLPSAALGSAEVRVIELVGAYAPFANGGDRIEPHLVRRVEDRSGRILWQARAQRERALDPAVAFVLTTMLQDAVESGTGSAIRAVGFRGPAAGKTGTTNDASDAWFIGYTPELVAGVWIGLDNPTTIVQGASGGTLAAPVWGRMMRSVYANRPTPAGWQQPPGVTSAEIDRNTGATISEWCPPTGPTYTEYFIGSAPLQQVCPRAALPPYYTLYDSLWIDEEWGDIDYEYPEVDYDYPELDRSEDPSRIEWPELEALRRRIELQRERYEQNRALDRIDSDEDPWPRDLPGTPRTGAELPRESPPDDVQDRSELPEGTARGPSDDVPARPPSEEDGPRLLGEPVIRPR